MNTGKAKTVNKGSASDAEQLRWRNIVSIAWQNRGNILDLLTDDKLRVRIQFFCVFVIFSMVSALMTVVNAATDWDLLMYSTLVFMILNLINIALMLLGRKAEYAARVIFALEIVTLFSYFAIMGQPEGFSVIWMALLPACGLLLYRIKYGIIISTVQFLILLFLFWTKTGNAFLMYDYTETFLFRFPLLYTAFFFVGAFFEYIRYATQKKLTETRENYKYLSNHDPLTGVYNRMGFKEYLESLPYTSKRYAFAIMDIDDFKRVNDQYGHNAGDEVLCTLAKTVDNTVGDAGRVCRWGGEEFAVLLTRPEKNRKIAGSILDAIRDLSFSFSGKEVHITVSMGMVEFEDTKGFNISSVISEADNNLYFVKNNGKNDILITDYSSVADEPEEKGSISEGKLLMVAEDALNRHEFVAYYQPQFNASTGLPVGAEALARWNSAEYGLLMPSSFVPAFERNGLISKLDLVMAENVFSFLHRAIESGVRPLPISINLSRTDVYNEDFLTRFEELRKQYGIPTKYVRLEVVESIAAGDKKKAQKLVERFHKLGYIVELDDFGAGYSSLNILKDIDYDVLKLDLDFLTDDMSGRSSTIVGSIVRMAKWLKIPVVAEGVETTEQAGFLRSVGCDYMQGYLYKKPMPESDFEAFLRSVEVAHISLEKTAAGNGSDDFWDNSSVDTLMLNSFVGGAAVLSYCGGGKAELLRANEKYLTEHHMNMRLEDVLNLNPCSFMDEDQQEIYINALERAVKTGEEQECETWRKVHTDCCGDELLCIRSNLIVIGNTKDESLIYAQIRNITEEKKKLSETDLYERQFKNVTEQANIYYWEYDVLTKDMHPCFRCMRDLGLPAVVHNYPEPAIEKGIFPPDYADMYRDWHKQIASGVESLESVIPLTVGRVPFYVRYTTEFDELGRPIKAYGSATLVPPEAAQ